MTPKKEVSLKTNATTGKDILSAVSAPDVKPELKSISDLVGGGAFYPNLPRILLTDIEDVTHSLLDAAILIGIESDFGTHDAALMLLENLGDGAQYTTICSGVVVVKKIRKLIELKPFPIPCTISKPGRYWDIT